MNAKKISISIFLILFVLFGAVSAIVYDKSDSVEIICYENSYAEKYAEEHKLDYEIISDSDAYIGILNLENFDYNNDGTIVAYKGESEKIAIPKDINGVEITKVSEKAFENAKNLKTVYLPKTVTAFEAKALESITVYMYEDSDLYKKLSQDKEVKFELKTIPESYFVDFYTANIPFSYDNINDKTVDINRYLAFNDFVFIPESIDGKTVTSISFDALDNGVRVLIIPKSVVSIDGRLFSARYDLTFLLGLVIAFAGLLFAVICVAVLKLNTADKTFLRVPQIVTSYIVVILTIIIAVLYQYANIKPEWILWVILTLVFGIAILSVVKSSAAAQLVEAVDNKVYRNTTFIKMLSADAEALMKSANDEEIKTVTKKVFETIRYSDPVSADELAGLEEKIENTYASFKSAVNDGDKELSSEIAKNLTALIRERNEKCKLFK